MNKFLSLLKEPKQLFTAVICRLLIWLPDAAYLKMRFRLLMGYPLNLDNPKTFNEKINWLKIYNRNPLYPSLVDKSTVKDYVAKKIGEEHVIPTYGVWDSFDEIDFDSLPDQFVLKSTNGGGGTGVVICRDKSKFNKEVAWKQLRSSLETNWSIGREWVYYDVSPRIIAEELLEEESGNDLYDYKLFCFNGKVRCFKVDFARFVNHGANYYDSDGILLPFGEVICPPNLEKPIKLPDDLNKIIELAETLAKDIPFVRIDFYDLHGSIYFGEMTFFPNCGFGKFTDDEWDCILGSWICLDNTIS